MARNRERFNSSKAAVFAMAGSAIGLGNIWRFPYVVGQGGGSAFIIVYLLFAFLVSLPILIAETSIGKCAQSNAVGAMKTLAPGTKWKVIGILAVLTSTIILSYYSVVGGWSISFLTTSIIHGFNTDVASTSLFSKLISNPWTPLVFHTAFLALTALIVTAGVKSGIELFNKASIPLLFILILFIAIYSLSLPGSGEGVRYLFSPDFSKLNAKSIVSAAGQSFFSLSIGVGCLMTYSSYMMDKTRIAKADCITTIFDVCFALMAGLAVMPALFAAGLEPGSGPGLVFESLPYIFQTMGEAMPVSSRIISILFFLTIVIAALTSSVSMMEVGIAYLKEEKGLTRGKSVLVIFATTWTIGVLCSLSFGPLSDFLIFGNNIFSFLDSLASNFLMMAGGLLVVLFVGWKMNRKLFEQQVSPKLFKPLFFFLRYIAPIVIILIFITNLISVL